jgi:hypothetical protein
MSIPPFRRHGFLRSSRSGLSTCLTHLITTPRPTTSFGSYILPQISSLPPLPGFEAESNIQFEAELGSVVDKRALSKPEFHDGQARVVFMVDKESPE